MMLSVAALVVFLVVFAGIAALVLILVLAALRKGRRQTGYNPNAGSDGTWLGPATAMDPAPQGDFGSGQHHGDATGGHHYGSSVDSGAGHFESGGHSSGDSGSGQSGGDSGSSGGGDSGGGSSSG